MNRENVYRRARRLCAALALICAGALPTIARAQDANTTLLLHFENALTGAQGEVPTQAVGVSYITGVIGRAAVFGAGNQARYASAGNINSTLGTLEFWVNPSWNGSDGVTHNFVKFGDNGGGMLFAKDGANNLRSIFNQYSVGGQSRKRRRHQHRKLAGGAVASRRLHLVERRASAGTLH